MRGRQDGSVGKALPIQSLTGWVRGLLPLGRWEIGVPPSLGTFDTSSLSSESHAIPMQHSIHLQGAHNPSLLIKYGYCKSLAQRLEGLHDVQCVNCPVNLA